MVIREREREASTYARMDVIFLSLASGPKASCLGLSFSVELLSSGVVVGDGLCLLADGTAVLAN